LSLSFENILLIGSVLIIVSIFATKSAKLGIPSLLLFLIVGMLAGSDGIGGIYFNDLHLSKLIGIVSLIAILFSGGLDTRFSDIKPILKQGIALSTLGVILTAGITGFVVYKLTNLGLYESFLLGSIISSTDAASVFSILRSKNSGLKGNIRPILEFESGSNDPMAYFLTIFFLFLIKNNEVSGWEAVFFFFKQFAIGGVLGIAIGYVVYRTINVINLSFEGLYSVLLIGFAAFSFAAADTLGGNGFLSVYLTAIYLGNKDFVHKRSLIKHFDGQAWFMQIIIFLTLGLLVFPKQLIPLTGTGLLISLFLMFIARPVVVFLILWFSKINTRAKIFIFLGWTQRCGPRHLIHLCSGFSNSRGRIYIQSSIFYICHVRVNSGYDDTFCGQMASPVGTCFGPEKIESGQ
jgi:cell volume regulation protein A